METINKQKDATIEKLSLIDMYQNDIDSIDTSVLSEEEEVNLANRVSKGDVEARELLFTRNIKLVLFVINEMGLKKGPDYLDLIQAGNIALLRAVDRFDPTKKKRFSSFAVEWIKDEIKQYLSSNHTIRVSSSIWTETRKLSSIIENLIIELGREPTDEELSKATGLTVKRIKKIKTVIYDPLSLDAIISQNTEKGNTFMDTTEDENATNPFNESFIKLLREDVASVIKTLTLDEQCVVNMRYGLNGENKSNTYEIMCRLRITQERVNNIEKTAMRKLRDKSRSKIISAYL